MEDINIYPAAMGRLAKALAFICGPDHVTTVALKVAAESGSKQDIKKARNLFVRLKPRDCQKTLATQEPSAQDIGIDLKWVSSAPLIYFFLITPCPNYF